MNSLRIGIINHFPFLDTYKHGNTIEINGSLADLWKYISKSINLSYSIVYQTEDDYGFQMENGSWSGAMGIIERDEADVVLGLIYPTFGRSEVAAFSTGYYYTPTMILSGLPTGSLSLSFYSVLSLNTEMYFVIPLMMFVVCVVIFLGFEKTSGRISIFDLVLEFTGTLVGKGINVNLNRFCQKIVAAFWFLAVFFIIAQIGAYLNANFSGRVTRLIDNLDDIIKDHMVVPVLIERGFYRQFFEFGEDSTYKEIWRLSRTESSLGVNLKAAMKKIQSSRGALIDISTDVFDFVQGHCNGSQHSLYLGKELFLWTPNIFLFNKRLNSLFVQEINNRIVHFAAGMHYTEKEKKVQKYIQSCFWDGPGSKSDMRAMTLEDIVPASSLWIAGNFLALLVACAEKAYKRNRHVI